MCVAIDDYNANEEWCCRLLFRVSEIEPKRFWRTGTDRQRKAVGVAGEDDKVDGGGERAWNDMQNKAIYELLVVSFFCILAKSFT